MMKPISCDTFVCLPPNTLGGNSVIFGKNSDRPQGEVQEIIFQGRKKRGGSTSSRFLKCTYLEIEESEETFSVILSKPSWMWGAEMGANEFGVVIGNEAVWTKLMNSSEDLKKKLLGMDLVRLGLERGKTAKHAMDVITSLLDRYGQGQVTGHGGPCSDTMPDFTYYNSFLIADPKEAWVLETVGDSIWAAERIESGFRNISNSLSIGTKIDASSPGLEQKALKSNLWDGTKPFHFARAFSDNFNEDFIAGDRFHMGKQLLEKYSEGSKFDLRSMMKILRDEPSGICRGCEDGFPSTSSQVSVLRQEGRGSTNCHWFTGTVDPGHSVFKPFQFGTEDSTKHTESPPVSKDRRHELYKLHEGFLGFRKTMQNKNKGGEGNGPLEIVDSMQKSFEENFIQSIEGQGLKYNFNAAVELEMTLYKNLNQ